MFWLFGENIIENCMYGLVFYFGEFMWLNMSK